MNAKPKEFEVEILFHTSSSPKRVMAVAVYTKDALLCVQRADGLILKYPLLNVFHVARFHGEHAGSSVAEYLPKEALARWTERRKHE